ncbi:kafirin PSKR2-like [Panicum virgatum]|uniref:Uncharacterized protein n=1 Tax=Panicum virgatum TaxID=38727 RepID=A0A8T0Q015_PANVG|nr:kafirin PSKR2-like [Panicum virgatum]KAG2563644.1 hypothetical protein PVAP13_8KG278522 [Panicum virgatum]
MATKIFALLALLAVSVSAATAVFVPQCSLASTAATIPQYIPQVTAVGFENPIFQSYRLQQALTSSIIASALWQQQSSAHLTVQSIVAQQQLHQLSPAFNQLAIANPAAYLQQQQLFQALNQLAVANTAAYLQQQQLFQALNQLAVANIVAYSQQQMSSFNQLAIASPAAILQQQLLTLNPLAAVNPTAFLQQQQQQLLQLNQLAATNPAAYWQQPIVAGSLF